MKQEIANGAPPETVFPAQEKGWMSNECFCLWLKHFINTVKPSRDRKVVLVLDGHVTHAKNLESMKLARESGVRMISLPPHTTHRLQPLDMAFFGPLSTYYDEAMRNWMRQNVGRTVTTRQVAELLGIAYGKAASVGTAMNGFRASGLWPLNIGVFSEADFCAAAITDVRSPLEVSSPAIVVDQAQIKCGRPCVVPDSAGSQFSMSSHIQVDDAHSVLDAAGNQFQASNQVENGGARAVADGASNQFNMPGQIHTDGENPVVDAAAGQFQASNQFKAGGACAVTDAASGQF
jgi:hypothetical protein